VWRGTLKLKTHLGTTEQLNHLLMDNLDNLLAWSQRVKHLLPLGTLPNDCKKVLHNAEIDVGFEQR
jgi:hypothetical protein